MKDRDRRMIEREIARVQVALQLAQKELEDEKTNFGRRQGLANNISHFQLQLGELQGELNRA